MFFLVFLLVPLVEIAFFVLIGQAVGVLPTLAGVLITALIGAFVLRAQGLSLIAEIQSTMGRGQLPARALAEAMMVGVAGLLLLLPGYFSDLLGVLLLIPPLRAGLYNLLKSRMVVVATGSSSQTWRSGRLGGDDTVDLDPDDWRQR
ncbi:MAG TPA: FxsA family protein [Devosiaceae bacterium]|nr:FxsA family protein [Devosiaceae bacterium]